MSSLPPPTNRPVVGSVLEDRYAIVGELGEGGIGWVYRAVHQKLGHEVAIKMLQTQFVGHDQMRPRFEREAKALAALAHPNIVTLTDYSVADGRPYLVMELLEGEPLAHRIDRGPIPEHDARAILRQVLEALAFAHQRGFVHRDLKPDNVFLVREPPDFVKLLDFGFVKLVDPSAEDESLNVQLTKTGSVFGTPAYMSPEQVAADRTDATTDVYSMGILMFEMLAGIRPFVGENPDVLRAHLMSELPHLRVHDLEASPELMAFLAKATAKKRAARFTGADEMLTALDALPSPWLRPSLTRESSAHADVQAAHAPTLAEATRPTPRPSTPTDAGASRGGGSSLGLGVTMVLLLALAGAGVFYFVKRGPTPESTEAATGQASASGAAVAPEQAMGRPADIAAIAERLRTATGVTSGLGPSPWDTQPSVPLLRDARARVVAGFVLDEATERSLRDYARAHHGDARPHLVLGEHFFLKRFRGDAIERLNLGQRLASDARNDPRMLAILLALASDADTTNSAGGVIATHYGAVARAAVESELDRDGVSTAAAAKLRALVRRLR